MEENQQATARENIMGTMNINPLLVKLSVPMMVSMLVQALYNVVDSIFVSHVSESALTAVSLAFSLQNVMIAVGVGTGVGVNALLSKSLGEKNQGRANTTAENGIFLALCSYVIFFVIGLTCMKPYFYAQTSDPDIQISFRGFRPSGEAIRRIYVVGLPSIAMQCVGSVMTFFMNQILMAFSATAVAVFGVYFKLQSFVFMPIFGLNNGMVPIISYNYGARDPRRVKKTIKLAITYAECIMLIGFCVFQFAPGLLLNLFAASDAMRTIGIPALRIICPHFLLAGIGIVLGSVFQALGNGVYSLIISVCRQLVVLIPVAWLLSRTGNVNMVWWAFLIAEVVSVTLSLVFMARINKNIIAPMQNA